ncbi:hypothetical protein COU49_02335 [Candidatus Nomurabacteria bacterium CG10_big_fil_rev_8_21_14_0_10_35_16]|uniref:DUF378 domain-containing protein n=1 Tax=Candidatus Nomurabacteria bacterium CG10_big_fil_rev_8_21_14_0_10_35_16 TaxID=1974731 RepID=A0A2H0TD81_9BACT|nr:MAG: hypothetical protein COU49_02335 [Candidatus Nomurabacteria bacterium CG10_big_fil_rev_8_21_14_0_10_35_16]
MCTMAQVSFWLLIIGGLNWGLVGLGMLLGGRDWNVVHMLLGSWAIIEAIVYLLVGIAAAIKVFDGCRCHKCTGGDMEKSDNGMQASM